MFQKRVRLANTVICVESTMPMEWGVDLSLFQSEEDPHLMVSVRYAKHSEEVGYNRVEETVNGFHVIIPEGVYPRLSLWQILSMLPMERIMMDRGSIILHANYVLHNGQAILFSGPSGIGKSTQGNLWEAAGEGKVINGDRVLLTPTDNGVQVDSYYLSGSSGICANVTAPLKSIVLLDKGLENVASSLKPLERFRQILCQISYDPEDSAHRIRITELIEKLLVSAHVIRYTCRKDESAVSYLKEYLSHN